MLKSAFRYARFLRRSETITSKGYASLTPQTTFGQPTYTSRPHLLKSGELTPGISVTGEYELRRTLLAQRLPHGAIVIVSGSGTRYMRGAAFHEFRQNANMFYLTGIDEPDTAMVMEIDSSTKGYQLHLYARPKNEDEEKWTGFRNGLDAAGSLFGADTATDIKDFSRQVKQIAADKDKIYIDRHRQPDLSDSPYRSLQQVLKDIKTEPLSPILHKLRLVKSPAEIALMRKVGKMSGRAYNNVISQRIYTEAEIQAAIRYEFIKQGCTREAYVPVIAGGPNANCIHYTSNNDIIEPNVMILVDAGGEHGGYLTDISRAWPASGSFSDPQKDLYQAILNVEKACINMCTQKSGNSLQAIHMESVNLMKVELKCLGFDLVEGDVERLLYPHRVGHHIGLEIHDCATFGGYEALRENQTITIEPGCYLDNSDRWPKHFRNMGMRIEDSLAVGIEAPTILSVEAVKEVADIEALCDL